MGLAFVGVHQLVHLVVAEACRRRRERVPVSPGSAGAGGHRGGVGWLARSRLMSWAGPEIRSVDLVEDGDVTVTALAGVA